MGVGTVVALAEIAGVPADWIVGGIPRGIGGKATKLLEKLQTGIVESGQVVLPRYDVRASAGAGALVASEDISDYFSVGRDWLRRNLPSWAASNAVVGILEGSGDSMEPTIRDGDLLFIVQGVGWRIVERGGIFVFTLDDRLLLKRLQVLDNGDLRIISDNHRYEPMTVLMDDIRHRLILHGYVFFHGGKPRGHS